MNTVKRRSAHRPRRQAQVVQTAEQPVHNAGEHYAASTAANAGPAVARDAQRQQQTEEQAEIASTLTAVLGVLGILVAVTAAVT